MSPSRFSATLPISSQFWWSLVSASTTHSAATSWAADGPPSSSAISIDANEGLALESDDGSARSLHLGIEADPRERLAKDLLVRPSLLEVLRPLLLEIGVLGALDRRLVNLLPPDLVSRAWYSSSLTCASFMGPPSNSLAQVAPGLIAFELDHTERTSYRAWG